jgi:hypothetical protein
MIPRRKPASLACYGRPMAGQGSLAATIVAAILGSGCPKKSNPGAASEAPPAPLPAPLPPADAAIPDVSDASIPPDAPSADQIRIDTLIEQLDRTPYIDGVKRVQALDHATLGALARLGSCSWSVLAALTLESQGDPSLLPRRGAANDPDTIARRLCLIANLPEELAGTKILVPRRPEFLRDFLPPRGTVKHFDKQCDGVSIGPWIETSFTRAGASGEELDDRFLQLSECHPLTAPGAFECSGLGRGYAVDITISPDVGGRLYIQEIRYDRIIGCD